MWGAGLLGYDEMKGFDWSWLSMGGAAQKLGLNPEALGEALAVIGLYNQMNKLADAYQVEPDVLPKVEG